MRLCEKFEKAQQSISNERLNAGVLPHVVQENRIFGVFTQSAPLTCHRPCQWLLQLYQRLGGEEGLDPTLTLVGLGQEGAATFDAGPKPAGFRLEEVE